MRFSEREQESRANKTVTERKDEQQEIFDVKGHEMEKIHKLQLYIKRG